jgi:hypothetical protein
MSNTEDRYLNGTQFTNVTVISGCQNDGSIEASGTLFVNNIKEYNKEGSGVNIEGSYFQAGIAVITSTENSINKSTASLIVYGGASILKDSNFYGLLTLSNTTNSYNTSDGSLVIDGGIGLRQNLNIGGITTLFNSTSSQNNTSGALISIGGISIRNTTDSISFTSGGALTVSGGVSIKKTLFANIINSNNATISNININDLLSNNLTSIYASINELTVGNIISSNLVSLNISSNNLYNNFSSISNLNLTYGTFGNINTLNQYITNATVNNLTTDTANILNFTSSSANIDTLTVGNLHVNNNFEYNDIVTNLSTANIVNNFATIGSMTLTNGTFGILYGSNLDITNITNSNLLNTNLFNTNLSSNNAHIINQTVSNSIITSASIANLFVSSTVFINNSTINNLIATNITSNNVVTITSSINNLLNIYTTSGFLILTGTTPSYSSSTGTLISYGGISINVTENSTSYTNGGSLTIAGGASIAQDLYVGNNIFTINSSSENLSASISTIASLIGSNIEYFNSKFNNLFLSGTNSSLNSTTGTLVSYGGVSINCTDDVTSNTNGGGLTLAGGATIYKSLLVGGTISSNVISSETLSVLTASINNFSNINSTITNLNASSINSISINSVSLTSNNSLLTNVSFNSLIGNYIDSNIIINNTFTSLFSTISNLVNSNSTINSLQLTNGTFGALSGTYLKTNNATLSSLVSNNIITTNQTVSQLSSTFNTLGSIIITSFLPSINKTTASVILSGGLTVNSTVNATSFTNGGGITLSGGLSVLQDVYISGYTNLNNNLDLNNNIITNVTSPNNFLDVTNKYYVDNRFDNFTTGNVNGNFTQGQVIIATINGNITGYSSFIYNNNTNLLSLYGTQDSTGLTDGGTLQVYGGATINKQLYVGGNTNILGYLDMNNQYINNLATPISLYDAANKYYVDNIFDNFTIGNVSGNFTQGQVIVASTGGNITGYDSLTFIDGMLSILTTTNSINSTNGGALTIYGGASFNKNVYIGTGLDVNNTLITNVALPITAKDAVNKEYVDFFLGISNGDIKETSFILNNNINIPADIDGFLFSNNKVSSFDAIVYLQIPSLNIYDQWEIRGVLKSNIWVINTKFIGDYPSKVTFSITNTGQIQYTNKNDSGVAMVRFRASTTSQGTLTNITIGNIITIVGNGGTGVDFFTQGSLLIGDGRNNIQSNTNLVYLDDTLFLNNSNNAINFTTATAIFSGGISIQKNLLVGTGIDLNMQKITNLATPTSLYDATNKDYVDSTFSSGGSLNLNGTVVFSNTQDAANLLDGGTLTVYGGTSIGKQLYVGGVTHFVNTTLSTSITNGSVIISGGLSVNGHINAISLSIINLLTSNLTSTNLLTSNLTSTNLLTSNLTSTDITSTNITSSNLISINITASNLISTNITASNLISTNITASNLISTNITTSSLYTNSINMTPSLGDIFKEISFSASDNVIVPDSITGFIFNNNVRYFNAWLSVFITATENTVTAFTIEGIQINSSTWELNYRFIGSNTKIKISITNTGQIQYTCPGITGFLSSIMKFRSITTSV